MYIYVCTRIYVYIMFCNIYAEYTYIYMCYVICMFMFIYIKEGGRLREHHTHILCLIVTFGIC